MYECNYMYINVGHNVHIVHVCHCTTYVYAPCVAVPKMRLIEVQMHAMYIGACIAYTMHNNYCTCKHYTSANIL